MPAKGCHISDSHRRAIQESNRNRLFTTEMRLAISERFKGCRLPERHRKNISDGLRGKSRGPCPDETKRKISIANKGRTPSAETRVKLSLCHKGKKRSSTYCLALSERLKKEYETGRRRTTKGQHRSGQSCLNISKALKGRVFSEEHKKNLSNAKKGKKLSTETRQKLSIVHKRRIIPPEIRAKMVAAMKISPKHKAAVEAWKGGHHSWETKRKISESHKKSGINKLKWKDPEYVASQMKARGCRPNKLELKLGEILEEAFPGEWKYVGDGQLIIGGKCPDFANVNGKKALVELYGDYWHRGDNPQERIDLFAGFGYKTLIIWERELRKLSVDEIRRMLKDG